MALHDAPIEQQHGASFESLQDAADRALAAGDVAAARSHASAMLRLTERRSDGVEHARARLRLARCDLAVARVERAATSALQAASTFRLHEDRAEEVTALALASRAATRAGRNVEATEAALLAAALAESLPACTATAQAFCALGAAYGAGHHFASADRAFRTAIETALRCDDRATQLDAMIESMLAQLARHACARADDAVGGPELQDLADTLERARRVEIAQAPGAAPGRALGSAIALMACLTGDVVDAMERLARHGEPLRAGIAAHWSSAIDAWTRFELAWHTHDPAAAVMHAAQIAAIADAAQHAPLRSLGYRLAAHLHESRGDTASALIEWKAELRHERAGRARDLESRGATTGAMLAARLHQLDVATLTAKAERFQQMAYEDSLTGIPNLRRFEHCLVDALVISADSEEPLCAAFIDCDHFKDINDAFGHEVGDRVLRQVAELLQAGVRAGDVAARLGGDEFAILFRHADLAVAHAICERIAEAVRGHDWDTLQPGLRVDISIGVEQARPGDTTRSLVARADKAMFEKKLQRSATPSPAVATPPIEAVPEAQLARVAHWLANAQRVVVFSGGADIAQSLPPDAAASPAPDDAAGSAAFERDWTLLRAAFAHEEPGPEQRALAAFADELAARAVETTFVTERIDSVLPRAGAREVIELHGNALRLRCRGCGAALARADAAPCEACGRTEWRPDVLLPGEPGDPRVAAQVELSTKSADVVLVIDSDAQAFPGSALLEKARVRGAHVVMIGSSPQLNRALADVVFEAPVDELLASLRRHVDADRALDAAHPTPHRLGDEAYSAQAYLAGHGTDHRGRTLDETLALSDAQLQQQSDVTQWMFPLPRRSSVCPEAPVVSVRDFALLAADDAVRDGMHRAYLRMLGFYGFEWAEDGVRKAPHWHQRFPSWARRAGSNDLRLTRILSSSALCGLQREAAALLAALEEEVPQAREGDAGKPLTFWRNAARMPYASAP